MCTSPQHQSQELEEELYETENLAIGSTLTAIASKDLYCWSCHKDRINIHCKRCPRSYHLKCIPSSTSSSSQSTQSSQSYSSTTNNNKSSKTCAYDSWLCCECQDILRAESEETTSCSTHGLSQMTVEELSQLLKFALTTIRHSADPSFHRPVLPIVFPDYHQLVLYPMDLLTIENNIIAKKYKSQLSFLADIKWIVHNCIIYNHSNHPLTTNAKYLSRVAKNEMAEMEICPDCFKNFYTITDTSFAEPCRKPHQLVYARVKGYPLWPAKVVRLGKQNDVDSVDCRFFGTHDRAWVAVDSCWLVSETHPGTKPSKTHKSKFEGAMRELAIHVERLKEKFPGKFKYSPQKTQFSPNKLFICEEDNIEHESFLSKINNTANNTIESNNAISNTNNIITDNNVSVSSNSSKTVTPGVFSLSSDKVLDELKSELKITNINSDTSSNLTNKTKLSQQMKDELSAKTRTARVGKRNVAEALRANKIQRTSTSSSSSALSHAPHSRSSQSSSSNCSPNNSHSPAITPLIITPVKVRVTAQSISSPDVVNEEVEKLRKQLMFDNAMHKEEIREIKHNADLVLMEMRQSWITEKDKAIEEERQKSELDKKLLIAQFEMEKKKLVGQIESAKRKQWCAECLKEAQLFCCYDTWYCSYDCQKNHWSNHVNHCQQIHKKS